MKKKGILQYIIIFVFMCMVIHVPALNVSAATLSDTDKESATALEFEKDYTFKWKGYAAPNYPQIFSLDTNGTLKIKIVKASVMDNSSYKHHYVKIYDQSGQEIRYLTNNDEKSKEVSFNVDLSAGTYYIKNYPASDTITGKSYSIRCDFTSAESTEEEKNDNDSSNEDINVDSSGSQSEDNKDVNDNPNENPKEDSKEEAVLDNNMPALTERGATLSDTDKTSATALEFSKEYTFRWEDAMAPNYPQVFSLSGNGILGIKIVKASVMNNSSYKHHYVKIYDQNGTEIMYFFNNDEASKEVYFNIGLPAGTYYIKNYPYSDTIKGKTYSICCDFTPTEAAEKERNDTKETATAIGVDTGYTGHIGGTYQDSNEDKYDVYKVSLTKGYTYQLTNTVATLTSVLITNEMAVDSTSGVACNVSYVAPYTGDYYVVVHKPSGSQVAYTITVKTISTEVKEDPKDDPDKDSDSALEKEIEQNTKTSIKIPKVKSIKSSKKKMTVKWNKVSCNGYVIQYSTKKNFKGAKNKIVANSKKSSITVKGLKSKKKYYVRICAYQFQDGKRYYSKWSGKKSIKVK